MLSICFILGGMKKEKQVVWRDMAMIWRHLCVCSLIDHSQRPMKMHIEVTLLYNDQYLGLVIQSLVDKPFSTNIFVIKTIGGGGGEVNVSGEGCVTVLFY